MSVERSGYLSFIQLLEFQKNWLRLGLSDSDLRALEKEIMKNPLKHKIVQGTGGLRTLRFSPKKWKRGKSGSTRVTFVFVRTESIVVLVKINAKNDQQSLSKKEKNEIEKILQLIEQRLQDGLDI
jgi:hypothetical protein